jgi:AraC family transcriptional regulator
MAHLLRAMRESASIGTTVPVRMMAVILSPSPSNHASPRALPSAPGGRGLRSTTDGLIERLGHTGAGVEVVRTRAWPQLGYTDVTFSSKGETLLPRLSSYLIVAAPIERAVHGAACDTAPITANTTNTTFVRMAAAPCRYAWQEGHRAIFVSLNASIVATAALETGMRPPSGSDGPASIVTSDHVCTHLLQVLTAEAGVSMHAAQKLLVESVANALALRLLAQFTSAQFTSAPCAATPPIGSELTGRRFARVREYIEHHLGDAIGLEELARVAGVSRFHFARQFRARTGESPMSYVLRTRIERAKTLLRDSRTRIIDIAAELGFADQSHFARTFRRLVGMPPSAYARAANGR